MVFPPPTLFLEGLGAVWNLLVGSESAYGFLGGWVRGGQGPVRVGSEEGAAGSSAGLLGLEAGGLAERAGAKRQFGPAACWLPLVLRLHQLGEGGFAS